ASAHSSSLNQVLLEAGRPEIVGILPLVVIALWLAAMAEMARMPIDDPTTHLELTMIHEALILENSGPNLAIVELGVGLKLTVLLGLIAQTLLLGLPPQLRTTPVSCVLSVGLIVAGALLIAL